MALKTLKYNMLPKLKNLIKNFDWSIRSIAKIAGLVSGGIIAFAIAIAVLGVAWRSAFGGDYNRHGGIFAEPMMAMQGLAGDLDEFVGYGGGMIESISARSMKMSPPAILSSTVNEDTEKYEKVSYNASIERYKIESVCDKVEALKPLDYVVFKSASRNNKYCSYRFGVESDREEDVADIVRGLSPKNFDVNIDTREPAVSGNAFESEILEKRLESIQSSLAQAERAYDSAITLATSKGNVEGLSTLITGKLNLVERLSNQRRQVAQQLARLQRTGQQTVSETEYAHFVVSISKKQIVDMEGIASSWRYNLDKFVSSLNTTLQKLTFGLVSFALSVVQLLAYIFVVFAFARFAWTLAKRLWHWDGSINKLLK